MLKRGWDLKLILPKLILLKGLLFVGFIVGTLGRGVFFRSGGIFPVTLFQALLTNIFFHSCITLFQKDFPNIQNIRITATGILKAQKTL